MEINVSTYKHSLGLAFYYENNTKDRKLDEDLKINASGVVYNGRKIVDEEIKISLLPGEKKLIELNAEKNNWSVQSNVFYKIKSV